jgi:dTDP-L-rhamnose 4-epimerase
LGEKILVTGGAGFIGSHLVDALLEAGHAVRVFDSLEPQVHGDLRERGEWPAYLAADCEKMLGDVRDREALAGALQGVDVVFHFAAATGVGQSMYQIAKYSEVNIQGTANLLDVLVNLPRQAVKVILASSRAIYGEGEYECKACGRVSPELRTPEQLDQKQWEIPCPQCGGELSPLPTAETKLSQPGSVYAITKLAQEQMCRCFGRAYGTPVVILRFFNVYGPRQSLANPYTGIMTTFAGRLMNGRPPEVYEDGRMTRDFVYVEDVIKACLLAMEGVHASGTFNVGSGRATSILDLAQLMSRRLAPDLDPRVIGVARVGDIRHCTADLTRIYSGLGYVPTVSLEEGVGRVIDGMRDEIVCDESLLVRGELEQVGLLRGGLGI